MNFTKEKIIKTILVIFVLTCMQAVGCSNSNSDGSSSSKTSNMTFEEFKNALGLTTPASEPFFITKEKLKNRIGDPVSIDSLDGSDRTYLTYKIRNGFVRISVEKSSWELNDFSLSYDAMSYSLQN
jgi:hypothetical protein